MSETQVIEIVNRALYLIVKVSAPMLLVSLIVGLVISILQTVTSIQEQTLTFVPKVLAIFLALMVLGNWMLGELTGYIVEVWSDFARYVR
jgi:flagellar biosynthetic protein FliQ